MSSDTDKENRALAEKLLNRLLKNYEAVLTSGEATAADRAALGKLLMANGYDFDANKVIKTVSDFLTKVDPSVITEDDEPAIVGRIAS